MVVFSFGTWAQGNSVIRNKKPPLAKPAPTGWGAGISFNSEETLDEFERPYWGIGAEIAYSPWENTSLDAKLGFQSPYASEDKDPDLVQGVTDLTFDWDQSKLFTDDIFGSLSSKISLILPTSELSQRQSKIFASVYGLTLSTPFLYRFTLLTSTALNISSFGYDYANEYGTKYNSPYGYTGALGIALNIGLGLSWTNTYSTGQRYDYGGVWTPVQKYVSNLKLQAPDEFAFSATYEWADRIYSNDPLFTDRKSSLTGEMSYEF
jgi:hypothetical protein